MVSPHPTAIAAAFISTGIISLAPNVLLFLFPNYGASGGSDGGRSILSLGQAIAVGGLLGDVFIHTLPDCFADSFHGEQEHNHSHSHSNIGLRILLGFTLFLILDIAVRSIEEAGGGEHSHGCNSRKGGGTTTCNGSNGKYTSKQPWHRILSSAVLLNLLGDSLHNFTDGLAIGASYSITKIPTKNSPASFVSFASSAIKLVKSKGGIASLSVFLHEIPHELGDFATLIKAGLSRNMAIGAQFLTAIAAFLGTAFGLCSGQVIQGLGHEVLIPFTAGGEGLSMICIALPFTSNFSPTHFLHDLRRVLVPCMRDDPTRCPRS
jgi:zinc transporter 7